MIYLPVAKEIAIDLSFMKQKDIIAWWFDPRDGFAQKIGRLERTPGMKFMPPVSTQNTDWVLIIDDPGMQFGEPGM